MTTFTEHPPVPKVLQEALKDYPELIAELQEGLKTVGRAPGMSKAQLTDQLEATIAVLEARLGVFAMRAAEERTRANATGDEEAMADAKANDLLMFDCRSSVPDTLGELAAFFA
ncbi:hypothetical protein [Hydrogenophaga sp. MI9]|uniref:hypothetical protein n=1 Tax=Hydrogenophaga sp. MI9 TaxID=3453719 RepID=UPI003EEBCB21